MSELNNIISVFVPYHKDACLEMSLITSHSGFSLLSGAELIYWFTLRLFMDEKKDDEKEDQFTSDDMLFNKKG